MDLLDFDDEMEDYTHEPGVISEENLADWCLKAEEGDAFTQYEVAKYLEQKDPYCYCHEIEVYSERAALQGYEPAVALMAEQMLSFHPGLLLRALPNVAEKGSVEAMWRLATCLNYGFETKRDPERAQYWYEKAAELGDGMQKVNLAIRYMRGDGVPQSMVKAMSLAHLATMNGITNAKDLVMRGEMDSTMKSWDDRVHEKVLEWQEWGDEDYDEDETDNPEPVPPKPRKTDNPKPVPPKPRETAQTNTAEQNAAAERKFESIFDMETKRIQANAHRRITIWSIFGFALLTLEILPLFFIAESMLPPQFFDKGGILPFLIEKLSSLCNTSGGLTVVAVLFDAFAYLPIGYLLLNGFSKPRLFVLRNIASCFVIGLISLLLLSGRTIFPVILLVGRFLLSPSICRRIRHQKLIFFI